MTAPRIAAALGGAHRSGAWWRCRCPVHDSRSATLALRDGDRGVIVYCHAGCAAGDVLAELRRLGLIGWRGYDRLPDMTAARGHDRDDTGRRIELARRIWNAAQDATGSPVARYFAGRGITMPLPPSLRWVPSLRRADGTSASAMIARIDSIDGELIGIARTWLDRGPDGVWRRRDRAMLGRTAGGAVRPAPAAETLMIGEGIETCLATMQATGQPAWAALSTSGMAALILPPTVRTVVILADNDANGAGERAARASAARWFAEGRRVRIAIPPEIGADMADVLAAGGYAPIAEAGNVAA